MEFTPSLDNSTSNSRIMTPEVQDLDNTLVTPMRQITPELGPTRCVLCESSVMDSSPMIYVLGRPKYPDFTCGHRVHSACHDASGRVRDAATAMCPTYGELLLAFGETDLSRRVEALVASHERIKALTNGLTTAETELKPNETPPRSASNNSFDSSENSFRTVDAGLRQVHVSSDTSRWDSSEEHQNDEKSFTEIHQALTDACRATNRACRLLLETRRTRSQRYGTDSYFLGLYLELTIENLLTTTYFLDRMLAAPLGSHIQGEDGTIFFTVCKKYLQGFIALVSAIRDQSDPKSEYVVIPRPVQKPCRHAAQLIASSRWSTIGDSVMAQR